MHLENCDWRKRHSIPLPKKIRKRVFVVIKRAFHCRNHETGIIVPFNACSSTLKAKRKKRHRVKTVFLGLKIP
jgi:hypothetical protein